MTDVFGHIGARKETGKGSLSSCLSKAAPHLGSVESAGHGGGMLQPLQRS